MKILLFTVIEFFMGSLMFSYWIGLFFKKDIREAGEDLNPGAFNLGKSLGFGFGVLGALLDFLKGFFPLVLLKYYSIINGWEIFFIGLAPIVGHAFSPFLNFKGGKGVAVSFGVWSALTFFEVSLVYAVVLAFLEIILRVFKKNVTSEVDSVITLSGLVISFLYIWFRNYEIYYLALMVFNFVVMFYKNRKEVAYLLRKAG
ncbi:MAG: glycerol-3-phosphate acyltransferase [Brevinematales bacterium]|nr:glycerol-3-phosphate acyltransferase [Brevinematales bacterium]